MKKRALSLALALVLVLTLIPAALADETDKPQRGVLTYTEPSPSGRRPTARAPSGKAPIPTTRWASSTRRANTPPLSERILTGKRVRAGLENWRCLKSP